MQKLVFDCAGRTCTKRVHEEGVRTQEGEIMTAWRKMLMSNLTFVGPLFTIQ
jgi:hypothetical protein